MANKTNFFIAFLVPALLVGSAFSDEAATQNWVKTWVPGWATNKGGDYFLTKSQQSDFFTKRRGDLLSTGTSQRMRDLLYRTKSTGGQYNPDYSVVDNPLHTTGQNAFDGINEVLNKVDGNDGTTGSAVQLETTAQNAYGAINELKGRVDNIAVPSKTSDLTNDSGYVTDTALDTALSAKADANSVYTTTEADAKFLTSASVADKANAADVYTKNESDAKFLTADGVSNGKMYLYTSDGWTEVTVKDTFTGQVGG